MSNKTELTESRSAKFQALYDKVAAHNVTATEGVDRLFSEIHTLAQLRDDTRHGRPLFERPLAELKSEGVPRLGELESLVKKHTREITQREQERGRKALSAVSKLNVREGFDPDAPWPRPLDFSPKFGEDARNAMLFLNARPERLIVSEGDTYSLGGRGVWRLVSKEALAAEVAACDGKMELGSKAVDAIVGSIAKRAFTSARPFEWVTKPQSAPSPREAVLFGNGLLGIDYGALEPLDGSYFATAVPEFDYDSNAKCPYFLQWLDERLDPSFHPALQEWAGYCMVPDRTAHRFAVLAGPSRTGKGTFKDLLTALVGQDHVASSTMGEFAGPFGLESALDKRLLVFPDAKDSNASMRGEALQRLLAITGGDKLPVNRKNKTALPNVDLLSRVVVLCNRHLKWIDESGALAARQITFNFDRTFEGHEDAHVSERLRGELPGIANWALAGLERLRSNNYQFTIGEEGRAAALAIRHAASPALRFAEDCMDVTGNESHFVTLTDAYDAYENWCRDEGIPRRNREDFANDLASAGLGIKYARPRGLEPPKDWTGENEYRPRILTGVRHVSWSDFEGS